jgi:hypothetical protein
MFYIVKSSVVKGPSWKGERSYKDESQCHLREERGATWDDGC